MEMGYGTKLVYFFKKRFWDEELVYMCHNGLTARWWTPGYHRNCKSNVICSYVTANRAKILDNMDQEIVLLLGLHELGKLLNVPYETLKSNLITSKVISWKKNPFVLGSYAYIPPGCFPSRRSLALPVQNTLFFAGEATTVSNSQTVHGALFSGLENAKLIKSIIKKDRIYQLEIEGIKPKL